ncbi:hypothetical protein EP227_07705 [bacterium]|nr:MAG: hypothetical protein EP227_07705 [bacterium]
MIKKHLCLTFIVIVCLSVLTPVQAQESKADLVLVKRSSNGYSLSINVINLPFEKLLEKLASQFPLRVITYGVDTSLPITINFKEVPLEQGIKQLLKESGIKNYFMQYRNEKKNRAIVEVLTLLGNGTKRGGETITEETFTKSKEQASITSSTMESHSPEDEFTEKITALKKQYEWADEETEDLAGYLLELMPEPARGPGMEALMNELDWRIAAEGNHTVDEEIFFQALENTVPSHLAPVMMDSIKQYSQQYKKGILHETDEQPPNELYREVMSKRISNRNNSRKGGSRYDYEND